MGQHWVSYQDTIARIDPIVMRASDITIAFPIILFAILLVVIIGAGLINLIIAVGLVIWARYARVIRGEVLTIMTQDYIARARVAGSSDFRIISRHIFPNVVNTLVVLLTLQVGFLIIVESSLSFLGAGSPTADCCLGVNGSVGEGLHRQRLVGFSYSGCGHHAACNRLQHAWRLAEGQA